ncbi:MAG: hypothetical protein HKP32_09495 [Woeseia sp.]|nr:hypothetical protein [Woeseia sp.]NNL55374.1 hypothetical protein [Woeseia sp.]
MNKQDEQLPRSDDEVLKQRAARLFDESVAGLDGQTRSRLNQARQRALAATEGRRVIMSKWLPLGAAAAVATIAIAMWDGRQQSDALSAPDFTAPTMATDFEILLDEEDFEMLEDLEFYSWLDEGEEMINATTDENVG